MDRSKFNEFIATFGLYRPKHLQRPDMKNAENRIKRDLRRVYAASAFAVLTCLTMSVSTTYAWFCANMKSSESVIRVASFQAKMNMQPLSSIEPNVIMMDAETAEQFPPQTYSLRGPAMPAAAPLITEAELEDALAIPEGAYAAGTYQMNIDYSGTTSGYCAFTVTPASLWSRTTEPATYYVRLGATDGSRQTTTVSLTLNEPAYVDVYSDWGEPLDASVDFIDETGVSFGEVLMIKVITADRGDSIYGVGDDTDIIYGIKDDTDVIYGIDDDTDIIYGIDDDTDIIYGVIDDTTIIGGQPADDAEDAGGTYDPVYSVEDDTTIVGGPPDEEPSGPGGTGGEAPSDKASTGDTVYSVSDDTQLILLPKRKDES